MLMSSIGIIDTFSGSAVNESEAWMKRSDFHGIG